MYDADKSPVATGQQRTLVRMSVTSEFLNIKCKMYDAVKSPVATGQHLTLLRMSAVLTGEAARWGMRGVHSVSSTRRLCYTSNIRSRSRPGRSS
jgi:hypothetical protein